MLEHKVHIRKKIAAVKKWKASGLSQAEFCRRQGLQQWELSSWKRLVEETDQNDDAPDGLGEKSGTDDPPAPRRKKPARQPGRQEIPPYPVEAQPFVPVKLTDISPNGTGDDGAASNFDCVLEVVLRRGQVVRVAPNCQPQFLTAVVSMLDCV